jgi:hypothetical protein
MLQPPAQHDERHNYYHRCDWALHDMATCANGILAGFGNASRAQSEEPCEGKEVKARPRGMIKAGARKPRQGWCESPVGREGENPDRTTDYRP